MHDFLAAHAARGAYLKTIIYSEQFYYPDGWGGVQLPQDLTICLAKAGWHVEVICGSDLYSPRIDGDEAADPRSAGIVLCRTPRLLGGDIHRLKLLKQAVFYLCALPLLLLRRRPALFVTQTNPPLLVVLAAVAALVHQRPLMIIAQDLYPELMFADGMVRADGLAGALLRRAFAWAYCRAAKVVALGEGMAQRLISKGVSSNRIEVISNWATGDLAIDRAPANVLRSQWGLSDHFLILYSGNIGVAHDIDTPIRALEILLERSAKVQLLFVGKGSRLAAAESAAAERALSRAIRFRPPVASSRLPQMFGLAQVALVTLRVGFEGLVVPSKLFGYMSRGIPTLYVGPPSDVESILGASGGGECFRNGAAEELADGIERLIEDPRNLESMGRAAARYYHLHFSRQRALDAYSAAVDSVVSAR